MTQAQESPPAESDAAQRASDEAMQRIARATMWVGRTRNPEIQARIDQSVARTKLRRERRARVLRMFDQLKATILSVFGLK